jgi:hypothetical protein
VICRPALSLFSSARDRALWVGEGRKAGDTPNEGRKAGIKKRSGRIKRGKSGLFYWESKKGKALTIPTSTRKEAKRLQKRKLRTIRGLPIRKTHQNFSGHRSRIA